MLGLVWYAASGCLDVRCTAGIREPSPGAGWFGSAIWASARPGAKANAAARYRACLFIVVLHSLRPAARGRGCGTLSCRRESKIPVTVLLARLSDACGVDRQYIFGPAINEVSRLHGLLIADGRDRAEHRFRLRGARPPRLFFAQAAALYPHAYRPRTNRAFGTACPEA